MKTVSLKKEVYQECLTLWGDSADWSEPETAATVVMEATIWVWEEFRNAIAKYFWSALKRLWQTIKWLKPRFHHRNFTQELGTLGRYSVCFHHRNQDLNKVPGTNVPLRKYLLAR